MQYAYHPPMSGEELLWRLQRGERYFAGARLVGAQIEGEDLSGVNLSHAQIEGGSLSRTKLVGADLSSVRVDYTNLAGTDMTRAVMRGTRLFYSGLAFADFIQADLAGADLSCSDLYGADFTNANLAGVAIYNTKLVGLDISPFCQASPPVVHKGPSTVDHHAIARSLGSPGLERFLVLTGMHEVIVHSLVNVARQIQREAPGMLQSTFISYGGPDTDFAQRLNDALLKNGVTTFFFAKDAIPGRKLHRLMREGVNQHDRVILVCSMASLDRPGVLNEIGETLQREARDGGKEYLIPITLDDYVFKDWAPEDPGIAQAIRDRVVADFRGAETDPAKFNEGVLRLIAALKK